MTKRRVKSASKASAKSAIPATRTKSFQPAWWGNVISTPPDTKSDVHPHAAASSVTPIAALEKRKRDPTYQSFPPVHTLILGTHPSIASLDRNEMYGHILVSHSSSKWMTLMKDMWAASLLNSAVWTSSFGTNFWILIARKSFVTHFSMIFLLSGFHLAKTDLWSINWRSIS